MNRYEVTYRNVNSDDRLEVEADKFSFQAAERVAYFYNKQSESPEAVTADVVHVRRVPGVKYFLDASDEMVEDPDFGQHIGLRVIMKTSLKTSVDHVDGVKYMAISRYLVEDENAPAEVEGHLVEIVCKQEFLDEKRKTIRYYIDDWKILE